MRIDFIKCHGSGNDFALVDARGVARDDGDWAVVARALADRRGAVGSDGLLLLTDGDGQHAFGMRMFNSDGSEAETCLNGLRCVARAGLSALGIDQALVRLKTSGAEVRRDPDLAPGVVTIGELAGPASLELDDWPMTIGRHQNVQMPIAGLPSDRAFTAVAIPNPHLIAFVDAIDEAELVAAGEACEAAPHWLPNRANVSFVEVRGPDALFVRTHERGVGLTDSCGSAMAASLFAACLTERADFDAEVTLFNRGGLVKGCAAPDGMVRLSGNATWEWEGSVEVDLDRALAGDFRVARHFNDEIAAWGAVIEGV
ncbi:diaminopimelate epimerase [Sphingomonas panacisoli]|uniref:Diaminopimelate epimerase n=1 Tax=Sphingomonas panacisoli TaxID=1813879 RepID=A0A5B8LKM7_9SPHN|nr:diaminopimelate epimerase [Sphingomonas panacisoli]QDZ08693.1 diaminopimelate epimerase [Sphingomonas panacisoli]